jgi:peptidylprolyl isomerase
MRKKSRWSDRGVKALIAAAIIILAVVGYHLVTGNAPAETSTVRVLLVTSMGEVTIELYGDMPITAGNFQHLVEDGVFDGTIFHRVVHDFVVQGGDASGKGITVPTIQDELPNKHSNVRGAVAMAKTSEPHSANSQFYINLKDNTRLDDNYSVFGMVVEGMAVVDAIGAVQVDANDKPLEDVTLIRADIVE